MDAMTDDLLVVRNLADDVGLVRISRWPEGIVLWIGGQIRWKSWEPRQVARPLEEWHEDMGDVLWWKFPVTEAPWVGSPLCLGHTVEIHTRDSPEPRVAARCNIGGWPGYHTHWTPLPAVPSI